MNEHSIRIGELELWMLPQRALWWPQGETLIVSDLHLGKAAHFRKEGIYLPEKSERNNLLRLQELADYYEAKKIWILGDFFHSEYNASWEEVVEWRKNHPEIEVSLIKGNHDILKEEYYEQTQIHVLPQLVVADVMFCHGHESLENCYTICGHIHPGIRMEMKARQSLVLPCFYKQENVLLIPAFGSLTGLYKLEPAKGSEIFALTDQEVLHIRY